MTEDPWNNSQNALERACAALLQDVTEQESHNATLELLNSWQQGALSKLNQQFATSSVFLAQNKRLAKAPATWGFYQFLTCDLLSNLNSTMNTALLLEVQTLCSRIRSQNVPYPETLQQACHSLACAVDACAQETLALEDAERQKRAECAAVAAENARLEARLQALLAAAESASADPGTQLVNVRRVAVANGSAASVRVSN